jgi:indolepyruvate decarboxylase
MLQMAMHVFTASPRCAPTARVTTCGELDDIIRKAESSPTGAYIEVVTDRYAASRLAEKLHESIGSLYA